MNEPVTGVKTPQWMRPPDRAKFWESIRLPETGQAVMLKIVWRGTMQPYRPKDVYTFSHAAGDVLYWFNVTKDMTLTVTTSELAGWWLAGHAEPPEIERGGVKFAPRETDVPEYGGKMNIRWTEESIEIDPEWEDAMDGRGEHTTRDTGRVMLTLYGLHPDEAKRLKVALMEGIRI